MDAFRQNITRSSSLPDVNGNMKLSFNDIRQNGYDISAKDHVRTNCPDTYSMDDIRSNGFGKSPIDDDRSNGTSKPSTVDIRPNGAGKSSLIDYRSNGSDKPSTDDIRPNGAGKSSLDDDLSNGSDKPSTDNIRPNAVGKSSLDDYLSNGSDKLSTDDIRPNGAGKSSLDDDLSNGSDKPSTDDIRPNGAGISSLDDDLSNGSDKPSTDDIRSNRTGKFSIFNFRPNKIGKSSIDERPNGPDNFSLDEFRSNLPSISSMGKKRLKKNTESRGEYIHRWLCLMICCLATFTCYLHATVYFVSLWPYLSQVDPSASESFFGYLVSAFSFGSAVASPLFGYWSNRIKSSKWPIVAGFSISIVGNLFMAFIEAFPVPSRRYVMLLARFITGFGAGNDSVIHAYLAHASTVKERSKIMSYQAAFLSGAILLGPGIAAALTPVGHPGFVMGVLHIDMYTLLAFICIFFDIICILLYSIVFKEYYSSIRPDADEGVDGNDDTAFSPVDKPAAVCCIIISFVISFCIVQDDSVGSAFSMAMFGWTDNQAVFYNGIIQSVVGVIDLFTNIFAGIVMMQYLSERTVILIGVPGFALFYVISFSWPGLPPHDLGQHFQSNGSLVNISDPISLISIENITSSANLTSLEAAGECNYNWCSYTPRIHIVQYIVAYFFMATAYPLAYTATSTLFSEVLGSGRQGVWQGVNIAVANIAMTISPILFGYLFEYGGPRVAWGAGFWPLMLTCVLIVWCWKRLVPGALTEKELQKISYVKRQGYRTSIQY